MSNGHATYGERAARGNVQAYSLRWPLEAVDASSIRRSRQRRMALRYDGLVGLYLALFNFDLLGIVAGGEAHTRNSDQNGRQAMKKKTPHVPLRAVIDERQRGPPMAVPASGETAEPGQRGPKEKGPARGAAGPGDLRQGGGKGHEGEARPRTSTRDCGKGSRSNGGSRQALHSSQTAAPRFRFRRAL